MDVRIIAIKPKYCKPDTVYISMFTNTLYYLDHRFFVSRQLRLIFLRTLAQSPGFVTYEELIDLLWGDDEDGGPDKANELIHKHMMNIRTIAAALGYRLDIRQGIGFAMVPIKRIHPQSQLLPYKSLCDNLHDTLINYSA